VRFFRVFGGFGGGLRGFEAFFGVFEAVLGWEMGVFRANLGVF
jgi:hypothetical protein